MIFTGFKRKSCQIFFNKKIKEQIKSNRKNTSGTIKNIVVVFDETSEKETIINELKTILNLSEEAIDFIEFQPKIKKTTQAYVISPKDFGWYGKIKSESLKAILTKKYDLLINYSKVESIYLNLVLLYCKTAFKVGFSNETVDLYDLIIQCNTSERDIFTIELQKYLKILNKIN